MNIDTLLQRLEKVRGRHPKWMACCPAHDDSDPSLSIRVLEDGRILIHCHAGCGASDVVQALGITLRDLCPDGPSGHYLTRPGSHRVPESVALSPGYLGLIATIQRMRAAK